MFELEQHSGVLSSVWDSYLRMISTHPIITLIRHGGDYCPTLVRSDEYFGREHGEHCTHDEFYMHKVLLVYMEVFRQRRLGPGDFRSGAECSADWGPAALFKHSRISYIHGFFLSVPANKEILLSRTFAI